MEVRQNLVGETNRMAGQGGRVHEGDYLIEREGWI